MDPGVIGARLASSVVSPLVKKLFVQEGPGAGLVDKPVRVSGLVSFRGEKRTLTDKDLGKIADELTRRAARDAGPHDAPDEEAQERVAERVAATLTVLGERGTGLTDADAVSMGHVSLARTLDRTVDRRPLAADEDAFYFRVLETACLHILHFFTQRSTFVARTLAAQTQQLRDLTTMVDVLIERLPSQSAQDAEFERAYGEHIVRKHSELTIYGLDLQHAREWPLDTAYLSLEATPTEPEAVASGEHSTAAAADPVPVEQALSGARRVLLRGIAGSGKTTLVQWLAVTTARQGRLTGRLAHLIGRVPFVLPLRTLTRAGARLPAPDGFLSAVTSPLSGSQPPGWADRVLAAGRGVLLIDGIDEVPEDERERTRRWLRDLLSAFPRNLFLVTSRPSAVRERWLGTDDFAELSLSSMRQGDVDVFIQRWHEAAGADAELGLALSSSIRAKPVLARLATNPLMCGLICALHRERRGFLPRGRKALYDAALSMLLERRDRERDMQSACGIEMDEESQVELLQRLAYWLIRNGRSEMGHEDAVSLFERVLPSMQYVAAQGGAEEIFRHLLVRSGLLREPGPESVDFVHRTFQDFLGAKAAVEERDFDYLVQHAHLDQWEDVLQMAVAHARPDERARLLRELVARGDAEPEQRARLHLLAMACLEHATHLEPGVRGAVETRARELLPPCSDDEARELADVGPVVLELLPERPEPLDPTEIYGVVQTASYLGGDAALELLTRYREDPRARRYMGTHWHRFDPDAYAERIISHISGEADTHITVRSDKELTLLGRCPRHPQLTLIGDFLMAQLSTVLDEHVTTRLMLSDNDLLMDLRFLPGSLEQLDLRRCPDITDLSPLAGLPLRKLWLWDFGPQAEQLRGFEELTGLESLILRGDTVWPGFDRLPRSEGLTTLFFPRAGVEDLAGLADFPSLEVVNLWGVEKPLTPADWRTLAELPRLERLFLGSDQLHAIPHRVPHREPLLPALRSLCLEPGPDPYELRGVADHFPAVRHVQIGARAQTVDLTPLAALPLLQEVTVMNADRVLGAGRLSESVTVTLTPRPRPDPTP